MTIISTGFVVTLLALVSVPASLAALVLMGVALVANRLAFHHRARVPRGTSRSARTTGTSHLGD